jgi:hypothetical protein
MRFLGMLQPRAVRHRPVGDTLLRACPRARLACSPDGVCADLWGLCVSLYPDIYYPGGGGAAYTPQPSKKIFSDEKNVRLDATD